MNLTSENPCLLSPAEKRVEKMGFPQLNSEAQHRGVSPFNGLG